MTIDKRRRRFVNLAESRVNRAIKQIQLVGNLANKSNYSYTEEDGDLICSALQAEIKELKARFQSTGKAPEPAFKLNS